jgi:hypothetical protein
LDISTADGTFIDWHATTGIKNKTRQPRLKWPTQGKPPRNAWDIWQKGLLILGTKNRNGKIRLHQPLGQWKSIVEGDWILDSSSNRVQNQTTGQLFLRKNGRPTRAATAQFQLWCSICVEGGSQYERLGGR